MCSQLLFVTMRQACHSRTVGKNRTELNVISIELGYTGAYNLA